MFSPTFVPDRPCTVCSQGIKHLGDCTCLHKIVHPLDDESYLLSLQYVQTIMLYLLIFFCFDLSRNILLIFYVFAFVSILCTEYRLHTCTQEAINGVQGCFHHQHLERLKNCQTGAVWTHAQQIIEVIACLHMLMLVIPSKQTTVVLSTLMQN